MEEPPTNVAGGSIAAVVGGKAIPADAPRIRHYIAALAASRAHQKLVMMGDEGEGGSREDKTGSEMVQRVRLDRGIASQRRVEKKKKNQQTMVDIMVSCAVGVNLPSLPPFPPPSLPPSLSACLPYPPCLPAFLPACLSLSLPPSLVSSQHALLSISPLWRRSA